MGPRFGPVSLWKINKARLDDLGSLKGAAHSAQQTTITLGPLPLAPQMPGDGLAPRFSL